MISIICWKWKKSANESRYRETYTAEHVNIFAAMVKRNLQLEHEIVCITDDAAGINKDVRVIPIWDDLAVYGYCYRRLKLFDRKISGAFSNRIVSMDLDCVILKDITSLFDNNHDFMIWDSGNSSYCGSMFMFNKGTYSYLWDNFDVKDLTWSVDMGGWSVGKSDRWVHVPSVKAGFRVGSDQAYISYKVGKVPVWKKQDGIYNFRKLNSLPNNAKIVFFPGKHDPTHKELYTLNPWIEEHYHD